MLSAPINERSSANTPHRAHHRPSLRGAPSLARLPPRHVAALREARVVIQAVNTTRTPTLRPANNRWDRNASSRFSREEGPLLAWDPSTEMPRRRSRRTSPSARGCSARASNSNGSDQSSSHLECARNAQTAQAVASFDVLGRAAVGGSSGPPPTGPELEPCRTAWSGMSWPFSAPKTAGIRGTGMSEAENRVR
jgi:hypothetical protein